MLLAGPSWAQLGSTCAMWNVAELPHASRVHQSSSRVGVMVCVRGRWAGAMHTYCHSVRGQRAGGGAVAKYT